MHDLATRISHLLIHLGPAGLVLIGTMDSSFLVLPMGNDLLLAALSARHPHLAPLYVLAAVMGSACGVLLLDWLSRKGGEAGLAKLMKPRQIERLKQKIERGGAVLLVTASLAPPPFPFSVTVAGAAGLQYPRMRLIGLVVAARTVRFVVVSLLAVHYGVGVLRVLQTPQFYWFMTAFIAICISASAFSIIRWIRRARRR